MMLGWVGGKSKLAKEIISIFPPHKKYIEPFFGGGWVFFKKSSVELSIINDISNDLMNLYQVVRDYPQELIRLLYYTPRSEGQFNQFIDLYWNRRKEYLSLSPPYRALAYFFLVKTSFNRMMKSYSINGSWVDEGLLETIQKVSVKLKGTCITSRDWQCVVSDYANEDTLVYLDPPYAITTANGASYYEYVLTKEQHEDLRNFLFVSKKKFKWVLSYDIHPMVEELYRNLPGIYLHKTSEIFQSSINKHSSLVGENTYDEAFKREYLITNFSIAEVLPLFQQEKTDGQPKSEGISK